MNNTQKVIDVIDNMYDKYKILYLAKIGTTLQKENIDCGNLQYVINHSKEYTVVHHPYIKEKIAVAKKGEEEKILHLLQETDNDFFASLPRAFVYAFCQSTEKSTYLSLDFPVKYHSDQDEQGSRKEVPAEYKIDTEGCMINKLPKEKRDKLKINIEQWCAKYNIDIANLRISSKKPAQKKADTALLKRYLSEDILSLIEAQPDEVRKKMVIPLAFFLK